MSNTIITNFPITVYGNKEKFSETISKGRCRVFYKGRNRNGTYITPEFAEKLIKSAPYTPVKGIYNDGDYSDHGTKRDEGRIYGLVPADPNFAWEKFADEDGVEREYACFDVLYYTALYHEAGEIAGKGESMELYGPTLKGSWQIIEGKKSFVFTDGCFLGLQALGDDVEPCFEGASFYSVENNILALLEKYEKKIDLFKVQEQGGDTMPIATFKMSDGQKYEYLFSLLNPNYNEEGGWAIEASICEVYDEYALIRNHAEDIFERVFYVKHDDTDSLEIISREQCYILDVNEAEKNALESLRGDGTYAAVADDYTRLTAENSQYSTKLEELELQISTLMTERDEERSQKEAVETRAADIQEKFDAAAQENANLLIEVDALKTFKKQVEDDAKKAVVENYVEQLPEEVIAGYLSNLDKYTIEDLDKELTYEQKKANPMLFAKTPATPAPAYVPKDDDGGRGIADILSRYERN